VGLQAGGVTSAAAAAAAGTDLDWCMVNRLRRAAWVSGGLGKTGSGGEGEHPVLFPEPL